MPVYTQATNGNRHIAIRLTLTELALSNDDITNNRSRIEWKYEVYETIDYGSWYDYNDMYAHLDLNGVRIGRWLIKYDFSPSGANSKVIASGTYTCPHNADGSKSMAYNAVFNSPNVSSGVGTATISGNLALSTIPRATTPTLSASSVNMSNAVTINTPRASSSFAHTLKYSFGGTSGTIAAGVGTSYSWTVPLSLASRIPNSTSGTCVITCETYNGSTHVGTKTVNLVLYVPSSVVPTITHSITEATSGLAAKFGAFIQNKSALRVANTASGAYSSTITSVVTEIQGRSYSGTTITSSVISASGTVPVKTTVKDSRGRSASRTTNVSVLAYSPPKITRFSVIRSNSSGVALDDGTYARVSMAFSITSLNSKNDRSWVVQYRQAGASTWTNLSSGNVYSYDSNFTSGSVLSTQYAYEFQLLIGDYFQSGVQASSSVNSAFRLMNFRAAGDGVAFGGFSTKKALESFLPAELNNGLKVNNRVVEYNSTLDMGGNCNDITQEWVLSRGSLAQNYPRDSVYFYIHTVLHSNYNQKKQIAYGYVTNEIWVRYSHQGNWSTWRELNAWSHITGIPSTASRWPSWGEVTGKPSTFSPSSHTHETRNHSANGYVKLGIGTILQWGTISYPANTSYVTLTYPTAFPSACTGLTVTPDHGTSVQSWVSISATIAYKTRTNARIYMRSTDDNNPSSYARTASWIAFGY